MTELKILSLDPATLCGWAHSSGASGYWDLNLKRDESPGMKLLKLRSKLTETKNTIGVDLLAYEAVRYAAGGHALIALAEIQGQIKAWCLENGVEYKGYSSTSIKTHATGKGRASKAEMVSAAIRISGKVVESEDEADAICLMSLVKKELSL